VPALLQVQRQQQDLAGVVRPDRQQGQVGGPDPPVGEQREVHQGGRRAALAQHEAGQQEHRGQCEQQRLGHAEGVACPHHGQHDQRHPRGPGDGARQVKAGLAGRRRGGQQPVAREQEHADRGVDEEHQPPALLHQEAAKHRPRGEPGRDDRPVHAERVAPGAFPLPASHEQRERGRRHDRGADPLHDPRGDEQDRLDCEAAGHAGHHEDDQPDPEHAGLAEQVREPAAKQQEPAEGDRVTADQPLQRGGADVQAGLDRGQRDVDDREVEHHHELRQGQHDQQGRARDSARRPLPPHRIQHRA
jgi:hypothetical protein